MVMAVKKIKELTSRDLVTILLIILGIVYSLYSVQHELALKGYCPSVFGVPSSYFYSNSLLLMLLASFLINELAVKFLFNLGLSLGILTSLYFSAMHLLIVNPSPSYFGLPSCYFVLGVFVTTGIVRNLRIQ
jgi:hypothetical protein